MANTSDSNKYNQSYAREGAQTVSVIGTAQSLREKGQSKEADQLLSKYSLVEEIPCLEKCPFLGLHSILDFHAVFSYEPLHNFRLGISRDLKMCLTERLKSTTLISTAIPTKFGTPRRATFQTIGMTVVHGINRMLADIEKTDPAKGLRINFITGGKRDENGLLGEDGKLFGMPQGRNYRSIDIVSAFIGIFADRCCSEISMAVTTEVFVLYIDIMQMSLSYNHSPV